MLSAAKTPRILPAPPPIPPVTITFRTVILSAANGVPGQLAGWGRKNPRISPGAPQTPKETSKRHGRFHRRLIERLNLLTPVLTQIPPSRIVLNHQRNLLHP